MLIYYLEDDLDDQELFAEGIHELDERIEVRFFPNGKQLTDHLTRSNELPNLFVLDINTPIMDGITVLSILRADERLRQIPAVMFSTTVSQTAKSKCEEIGCAAFFRKGFTISELNNVVSEMLQYAV